MKLDMTMDCKETKENNLKITKISIGSIDVEVALNIGCDHNYVVIINIEDLKDAVSKL